MMGVLECIKFNKALSSALTSRVRIHRRWKVKRGSTSRYFMPLFLLLVSHNKFARTSAADGPALSPGTGTVAPTSESSLASTFEDSMNGTFTETVQLSLSSAPTLRTPTPPTQYPTTRSDLPIQPTISPTPEPSLSPSLWLPKRLEDRADSTIGDDLVSIFDYVVSENSTASLNSTNTTNSTMTALPVEPAPSHSPIYLKTSVPISSPDSSASHLVTLQPTIFNSDNRQGTPGASGIPAGTTLQPTAPGAGDRQGTAGPNSSDIPVSTPRPTTANPTLSPTGSPSGSPTLRPTSQPTFAPTRNPTKKPTETPTASPTRRPTPMPSPGPTPMPSPGPTLPPTEGPTRPPTLQPTPFPTTRPPTSMPSAAPSSLPSFYPTISFAPTTETRAPTSSSQPSGIPSSSPTNPPSTLPSGRPSLVPSVAPTMLPSGTPSQAPSLSLQKDSERVVMTLRYCAIIEGVSIITWEQITATHIRQTIVNANIDPPLEDLRVWTNIIRQTPVIGLNDAGIAPNVTAQASKASPSEAIRRRSLLQQQTNRVPLRIAFDTAISYRSAVTHNIQELISNAFNTDEDRNTYINMLKRTNDGAFLDLNDIVSVSVGGVVVPAGNTGSNGKDMTLYIIIGSVAGGVAVILLIALLVARRRMSQNSTVGGKTLAMSHGYTNSNGNGVTAEIVVEHNRDEVSTLGDPMYSPAGGMMIDQMERDEHTASVGDDYDYKYLKHHNFNGPSRDRMMSEDTVPSRATDTVARDSSNTGSQSKLGFSQMGESIFSDDASFEEQFTEPEQQVPFEISVPAGKLGMVIDTPNGGFPIVHAIKDTSILADRVRVGDRLVSVDGQDCTSMTAVQVSKLISLKSDQESRVLVFVRSKTVRPGMS